MSEDPTPYIPRGGIRVTYRGRVYTLVWANGTRMLVNSRGIASYALEPEKSDDLYHYNVYSVETGKKQSPGMACYMVRVYKDRPLPKRPWWH
jgi:hypothetical protein